MTKANLKVELLTITENLKEIGLQLFFVFKEEENFEVYQPALDSEVLEPSLKKDYIDEIKSELLPQNVKDESNIEAYKPGDHDLSRIWAVVIKIANADKVIYLFKKNYAVNVIKRGKVYPVFFANGALKLEEKELLKISKTFDFLYLQGELIILKKDDFERSFDYVSAVEKRANACIDLILESNILDDASKIYDLAQKRGDVKKILSIKADNPVLKKSPKQIASFAKKYGMEISLSEDKLKLELKNQKEAKALLKIFNDDYLISEMTKNRYDSKGKLKVDSQE